MIPHLKPLFLLLMLAMAQTGNSQSNYLRKVDHNTHTLSALRLSGGNTVILGGKARTTWGIMRRPDKMIYTIDSNGNYLNHFTISTEAHDLFEGFDQNVYQVISADCVCTNCWTIDKNGMIYQIDAQGNLLNYAFVNNPFVSFNTSVTGHHGHRLTPSHSVLFQETDIYFVNDTGYVDQHITNSSNISDLKVIGNNLVLMKDNTNQLMIGDTNLNVYSTLPISGEILLEDSDSVFLIERNGNIELYDNSASLIGSISNLNVVDVSEINNEITVLIKQSGPNYQIDRYDDQLNLINSYSISCPPTITYKQIIPYHNHFLLIGNENTGHSVSLHIERQKWNNIDPIELNLNVGILEILLEDIHYELDSLQVGSPNGFTYYESLVNNVKLVINNSSNEVVDSLHLHVSSDWTGMDPYTICPYYSLTENLTNLDLQPNEIDTIDMGNLKLLRSGFEVDHTICAYADIPNGEADKNYVDNLLCEQQYMNDISERRKPQFKLYPNPAESIVNIELEFLPGNVEYQIMDMQGRIVDYGQVTNAPININQIGKGIYLVNLVENGSSIGTEKLSIVN